MNPTLYEGTESFTPMVIMAVVMWLIAIAVFIDIRREK
jgi:hypothetical protein